MPGSLRKHGTETKLVSDDGGLQAIQWLAVQCWLTGRLSRARAGLQASSEMMGFRVCTGWLYSRSSGYAVGRDSEQEKK